MNSLSPSYFFDLSRYRHNKIFEEIHHVWEALLKIREYLDHSLGKIEIEVRDPGQKYQAPPPYGLSAFAVRNFHHPSLVHHRPKLNLIAPVEGVSARERNDIEAVRGGRRGVEVVR